MRFDLRRFDALSSTMDAARALADAGAPEGVCVVASAQTAGRGRHGRAWYSPPNTALYVSLVLRPTFLSAARAGWLSMLAALAVRDGATAILAANGRPTTDLGLKWPNDVQLGGRKLAGILIESAFAGDTFDRAIIGIGLNVNTGFDQAPDEVRKRAISLSEAVGKRLDLEGALSAALEAFDLRYEALREQAASPRQEYARHLDTLGARVRIARGPEWIEGVASAVGEDGALRIETVGGPVDVAFGDVE